MAFTGSFTVSQGSDFTALTITDTSSYSSEAQGTFSGRRIYLIKSDGTTLVPLGTTTTYIDFPFSGGNSITIDGIFMADVCLLIEVQWLSNAPQPGSTYTAQEIVSFLNYLMQFSSGLLSNLSDNPALLNDTDWYNSLMKLQVEIQNAIDATDLGQQLSAQNAINRAYYLMNNSEKFF